MDFVWWFCLISDRREVKLALEVEGGVYQPAQKNGKGAGGGHRSITGFNKNMEKYNALAVDGWLLLRVTPDHLQPRCSVQAIDWVAAILKPIWITK